MKRGFTMMEMLVVFILIAILAQIAIVTYRDSVQNSKRDHAKAVLSQIAAANQNFMTDFPSAGIKDIRALTATSRDECSMDKYSKELPANVLINCGYLEPANWGDFDYDFFVCDPNSGNPPAPCAPGVLAYMKALEGAGKYFTIDGGNPDVCLYTETAGYRDCN